MYNKSFNKQIDDKTFICEECISPCYLTTTYNEQPPEHCPYDLSNYTSWKVFK